MQVAENTLAESFWLSETIYKSLFLQALSNLPKKQTENEGLKAGMLCNIVFDTHWDEFLGNSLVF